MRKLFLLCLFFFNLLPVWKHDGLSFFQLDSAQAQNAAYDLRTYLQSLSGAGNHQYQPGTHSCGCQVIDYNLLTNTITTINTSAYYASTPNYRAYITAQNLTPPAANSGRDHDDDWNEELSDAEFEDITFEGPSYPNPEDIFQPTGFGYESGVTPANCTEDMGFLSYNFDYFEASTLRNAQTSTFGSTTLPCANKYLVGGNIIRFSNSQVANIGSYQFDGSFLNSVTFNNSTNDKYLTPVVWQVTRSVMLYESQNPELCGPNRYYDLSVFTNPTSGFTFICWDNVLRDLNSLSTVELVQGQLRDGQPISGYKGLLTSNLAGYTFTLSTSDIVQAQVGDQVLGQTTNGTYYCITLTAEDIDRGLKKGRDSKYIPESAGMHLDHPVNLAWWARAFLDQFAIPLSQCTIDAVNAELDVLHQRSDYTSASSEGVKAMIEYQSLAYNLLFSGLKCWTNEEAAKGKGCAQQFGIGALHELIESLDIVEIIGGLIKIEEGATNLVQQNVKDMIDGIKSLTIQQTPPGGSLDPLGKSIIEKNNPQAQSLWTTIEKVADNFKKMYFTQCDQYQFQDGSTGSICCYRDGQLTLMVLPLVLTGGDYAITKLTGLAAKYGSNASKATKILADAEKFGAKVSQSGAQLLIKESDDVGAVIISTEERIANDVVITGEQDLEQMMDVGDLNNVAVSNPVVNNVIQAVPGTKANGWNKDINKLILEPGKTYESGNFKYTTDTYGNVNGAHCDNLTLSTRDPNKYQQWNCRQGKDGITGDDGGHLFGKQFDGPGEQINLQPMNSTLNQSGGYHQMEELWRSTIQGGGTVTDIQIDVILGTNKRPIRFDVSYKINNGNTTSISHLNQ